MKSGVTWQIFGVAREAREAAHEAARRAGMSVGDWLEAVISKSALARPAPDPEHSAWSANARRADGNSESEALDCAGEPPASRGAEALSPLDQALMEIA